LWDTYSEDKAPVTNLGRFVRIAVLGAMAIVIFTVVSNQSINLLINVAEFGDVFTKTISYSIISGVILAAIALVRVNFVSRHSIIWYGLHTIVNFVRRTDFEAAAKPIRYTDFKMSPVSFGLWQITKVALLASLFANLTFGMAVSHMAEGNDIGFSSLITIFGLPFAEVPSDGTFAQESVIPAVPTLTFVIPAILGAIGFRLLIYIGISGAINIVSGYILDSSERKPKFLSYISTVELIVGAAIFWAGFTIFFSPAIDFNTKYLIVGALALGAAFLGFGVWDRRRAKVMIYPSKKHLYSRIFTALAIIAVVGSIVVINMSIADAKKLEYRGPYIAQEIAVNRFIAELDNVSVVSYNVTPPSISASAIGGIINENRDTLDAIRLWDREAAGQKLRPELGQRNDILFADTDILRFGDTMYWTSTTAPKLPDALARGNEWFNQHFVYTHTNAGFKMLRADTGNLANSNDFFNRNLIYYGESGDGGLFSNSWAAYPVGTTTSNELEGVFYNGTGGVDLPPPLSWMFEPNFMLSYPDTPIHVMRYKDIHDRMGLLYPYFTYDFGFYNTGSVTLQKLNVFPVTDGTDTYWLMPLVAALDTSHVPWGAPFMLKLVGYSLIDSYNGDMQIIVTGEDAFSEMFYNQYREIGATREVPDWLEEQIRYPEEMFIWKISKFNRYHVTDPKTFIEGRQFYNVPQEAPAPYYIITEPQGFESPVFIGFQSLELEGSQTKNLVGYMIVENDLEGLGNMTFYSVPLDSVTKLIGPSAAREALEKDEKYKNFKTLLQGTPRVGENILYKIGEQEVYFMPVYTAATSGGVVSQLGTVAAVGASVTGTFYVGLGDDSSEAFENYLLQAAGRQPSQPVPPGTQEPQAPDIGINDRIAALERIFADAAIIVLKPTSISAPLEFQEVQARYMVETDYAAAEQAIIQFISDFAQDRVYEWRADDRVNFGVLREEGGIVENHYISIEVS
jgi:uncharacterized protein